MSPSSAAAVGAEEEDKFSGALFWPSESLFGEPISTGEEKATFFFDGVSGLPGDVTLDSLDEEDDDDEEDAAALPAGRGTGEGARPRPPSIA